MVRQQNLRCGISIRPMSAMGLGRAKTPALASRVETSRSNCISESQIILHRRGSMRYLRFPVFRRIPAILRGRIGPFTVSVRNEDRLEAVWSLLSLASENRFPARKRAVARDSVRMRQRRVCVQEFREELAQDGHAIIDALAISPLAAGARARRSVE